MKRLVISLFILLFLLSQPAMAYEKEINTMSVSMADKITASGKKTIAVVDFTDLQGNVTELGRFLAEEFSVSLAETGKNFEVVDRTHLKSIIKEHKLSSTGIIDSSTARQLGKIAGVESLITGTITPFGDTIRIAVKILDTTTAKIIGASRTNLAKTGALVDLISTGIEGVGPTDSAPSMKKDSKPSPKKAARTIQTTTLMNTKIDLKSCVRSENSLQFNLVITNLNKDDTRYFLHLNYQGVICRMFDMESKEYRASGMTLGEKSYESNLGGVEHILVKNLPTKSTLAFSDIPTHVTSVALLEFVCWDDINRRRFTVKFRNIPIIR